MISGFSILRNGVKYDFPFLESWRSILPLVDELVLAIGLSEDDTLAVAKKFAADEGQGKVKIIETVWDPALKNGQVLSVQTNIALDACTYDWSVYIQADEVFHEQDLPKIRAAISAANAVPAEEKPEALVFKYIHFYGNFSVVQETRSSYRREIRAIRKSSGARSVGDAQSFRHSDGRKLNAWLIDARVYHYGWVRPPEKMREKTHAMDQLYHAQTSNSTAPATGDNYRYKRYWGLKPFQGTHPQVMKDRIQRQNWVWDLARSPWTFHWKDVSKIALDLVERATGQRLFEFKNYVLIKEHTK